MSGTEDSELIELSGCVSDLITVIENDLTPGDVVKVNRGGGVYYHYGVYYDNGSVFHCSGEVLDGIGGSVGYCGSANSSSCCKAEIIPLHRFTYYEESKVVVEKRTDFVNGHLISDLLGSYNYNLFTNNCEHLANYISEGHSWSYQVTNGVATGAVTLGAVAGCIVTSNPLVLGVIPVAGLVYYGVSWWNGQRPPSSSKTARPSIVYEHNYPPPAQLLNTPPRS